MGLGLYYEAFKRDLEGLFLGEGQAKNIKLTLTPLKSIFFGVDRLQKLDSLSKLELVGVPFLSQVGCFLEDFRSIKQNNMPKSTFC